MALSLHEIHSSAAIVQLHTDIRQIWCVKKLLIQNPWIREYTLNYSKNPNKIYGIFLNYGVLESLGSQLVILMLTAMLIAMRARLLSRGRRRYERT